MKKRLAYAPRLLNYWFAGAVAALRFAPDLCRLQNWTSAGYCTTLPPATALYRLPFLPLLPATTGHKLLLRAALSSPSGSRRCCACARTTPLTAHWLRAGAA